MVDVTNDEYWHERRRGSALIYFRDAAELQSFKAAAKAEGFHNFSRWVLQKLVTAMSGHVYAPGFVEEMQQSLAKHKEWLASRESQIAELRKDLRAIELEREDLRLLVAAFTGDVSKALQHVRREQP